MKIFSDKHGLYFSVYGQATYDCRRLDDCQNGGVCSISDGKCQCANGFEGYNCQIVSGRLRKRRLYLLTRTISAFD